MKKAVIETGGKQHFVSEGEQLDVELLNAEKKVEFAALLVIDEGTVSIGSPTVSGVKVQAEVIEQSVKDPKVVAIRYKPKKRVRKTQGHRQQKTRIKILAIT